MSRQNEVTNRLLLVIAKTQLHIAYNTIGFHVSETFFEDMESIKSEIKALETLLPAPQSLPVAPAQESTVRPEAVSKCKQDKTCSPEKTSVQGSCGQQGH